MNIVLSDKFKDHVESKDIKNITIKYGKSCSSWGGSFRVPEVLKKKPESIDEYNKYTINGINFFVHKGIKTTKENQLTLRVRGFLFLKEIYVEGLDLVLSWWRGKVASFFLHYKKRAKSPPF